MNVLVVEDNQQVALSIKKTLSACELINFVDVAHDFNQAFNKVYSEHCNRHAPLGCKIS